MEKRVIKRYNNRKLYDTKNKEYITLLDIENMIRQGEKVKVVEWYPGAVERPDITGNVLLQVVANNERNTKAVQYLEDIIRLDLLQS